MLTGLLVPYLTRQWQSQLKQQEIKTNLVSEISEMVLSFSGNIEFQLHYVDKKSEEVTYYQEFNAWRIKSGTLGARLRAYYPRSNIGDKWDNLINALQHLYNLSSIFGREEEKAEAIEFFKALLIGKNIFIDWDVFLHAKPSKTKNNQLWLRYEKEILELQYIILSQLDELNDGILKMRIRHGA